jgi:hypothetical protein
MNMKKIIVVCSVLAVSSTLTMQAQQGLRGGTINESKIGVLELQFARPIESKVVKGMPYTAEIATESIQTLADGNRIVQRSTGRVYRDVEGRVRREDDRPSGSPNISITDPVADTSFTLDPANRTAREMPGLRLFYALRQLNFALVKAALKPDAATSTAGGRGRAAGGGGGGTQGSGGAGGGARDAVGRRSRDEQVEERLPNRVIEGVLCSGIRRTTTIAKDAIGNEQPIRIVSEEWTSIDLQVLVLTDLNDPRTGRSTYRLSKVTRVDPDPALFKVPADYTLQRAVGRGRGGVK